MQIDAQLVRDLFACCRKMQRELHFINCQALALKEFQDPKMREKCIENIEGMTEFIYSGADGFPSVVKTLECARDELKRQGEWWTWSDYVGFRKTEGGSHA